MYGVSVEIRRNIDGLETHAHDAAYAAAIGYCPPASWSGVISICVIAAGLVVPVRGDNRSAIDIPALLQVVGDEVLQRHLIHVGTM
jgi:hypothetical protein